MHHAPCAADSYYYCDESVRRRRSASLEMPLRCMHNSCTMHHALTQEQHVLARKSAGLATQPYVTFLLPWTHSRYPSLDSRLSPKNLQLTSLGHGDRYIVQPRAAQALHFPKPEHRRHRPRSAAEPAEEGSIALHKKPHRQATHRWQEEARARGAEAARRYGVKAYPEGAAGASGSWFAGAGVPKQKLFSRSLPPQEETEPRALF